MLDIRPASHQANLGAYRVKGNQMAELPVDLRQRVLAESWVNPEFRDKLHRDPRAALADLEIETPADIEVRIVTQSNTELVLLAAENPAGPEMIGDVDPRPEANWTSRGGGCGGSCTLTAECFCPGTATGSCICPV